MIMESNEENSLTTDANKLSKTFAITYVEYLYEFIQVLRIINIKNGIILFIHFLRKGLMPMAVNNVSLSSMTDQLDTATIKLIMLAR